MTAGHSDQGLARPAGASPIVWRTNRRIYLQDTDASGLLFFGAPTRWIAEGESELMMALGFELIEGDLSIPIRSFEIEYLGPLRLHDEIEQRTWVGTVGTTSLELIHEFWSGEALKIRASTRHVAVQMSVMEPTLLPDRLRRAAWGRQEEGTSR